MKIATTFSKEGFFQYGKRCIDSILEYWPNLTSVVIYVDFDLQIDDSRVTIKKFADVFPGHKDFVSKVTEHYKKANYEKAAVISAKTIKFSYKSFVISQEVNLDLDKKFIWLDGDTETISSVNEEIFTDLLQNKWLACQVESPQHRHSHVETGILIFNQGNEKERLMFSNRLLQTYNSDEIFSYKKPYDGYIISNIVKSIENYVDLNARFNVTKKRSNHAETFLHPVLKKHFVHWIGQEKNVDTSI